MHLHPTEVPVMLKDGIVPVGYAVHTADFSFMAIYETDGTVNVHVEWGDDQPDDMVNFPAMSDARGMLETLLGATKKEAAKPENDISKLINESVDEGLKKAGLPDTPNNRVGVLNGMHSKLIEDEPSAHAVRHILRAIEDEILELQTDL